MGQSMQLSTDLTLKCLIILISALCKELDATAVLTLWCYHEMIVITITHSLQDETCPRRPVIHCGFRDAALCFSFF